MDSPDVPPANFGTDDSASAEAPTFTGYRGKYGLLKTNIVTSYATIGMLMGGPSSPDGMLFLTYAEPIAEAWIAWGKSDPRYMRIVNILWGGPFMTLMLAHTPLIAGVMANHNIQMPFARLLNPLNMKAFQNIQNGLVGANRPPVQAGQTGQNLPSEPDPFMANYHPVGAHAPTEDAGPPPPYADTSNLRVFPDEGIPSDIDVQLRQLSREMNKPYEEVVNAYLLEVQQARIAEQQRINKPGTLGMPVTPPGA